VTGVAPIATKQKWQVREGYVGDAAHARCAAGLIGRADRRLTADYNAAIALNVALLAFVPDRHHVKRYTNLAAIAHLDE
jgi:hypothetical protein